MFTLQLCSIQNKKLLKSCHPERSYDEFYRNEVEGSYYGEH